MKEKDTLKLVPRTVFERSVTFEVVILKPTIFDRIRKRRRRLFSIQPSTLGTMLKISEEVVDLCLDEFDKDDVITSTMELIAANSYNMARIVALAVCNSKDDPTESLVQFFLNNLTAAELSELVSIILKQIDTENFLKSIISARGVNLLSKMNPSTRGSTLAPGKPLAV